MNKRRVKCPHCGVVCLCPENWTDEKLLQNHFDLEYDNVVDLTYGDKPRTMRNPCYGRKVEISGEKIERYTKELLDGLEVGGVII